MWTKSVLVFLALTGIACATFIPGGPRPIEDATEESVVAAATFAVEEMNKMSNSVYKMVFVKVDSGTQQVVNGVKYSLIIETGLTQCLNDYKPTNTDECPVVGQTKRWLVTVWVEPTDPPMYHLVERTLQDATDTTVEDIIKKAAEDSGFSYTKF